MEYITKYPKTVLLGNGDDDKIHVDKMTGVEELHLIVKESAEKMRKMVEMSVEKRVAMGLSGRQYVEEKFDEKVVIKQYVDAIERCV